MKSPVRFRAARSLLVLLAISPALSAADPKPAELVKDMERVADWQLANPSKHAIHDWTQAPFFLGLANLYQVTGEEKYREALDGFGKKLNYGHGPRITHADDNAVLQAWLEMDRQQPDPAKVKPAQELFDKITADLAGKPAISTTGGTFVWSWCDALFMSPPVWSHLSKITGDPKYLEWSDREWWTTTDVLYDPQFHLFYRDARFFTKRTPSGKKVFWSRGNGWVVGGLIQVLDDLPADHPSREKYLGLYSSMMVQLLKLQGSDGLWRMSLLDPMEGVGETSGSAFFTYALAWGVNRGFLSETFRKAALDGWTALVKNVHPDGMIGFVQKIGDSPSDFTAESTEVYGSGAFLLAGSELVRMLDPSKKKPGIASFDMSSDKKADLMRHGYIRSEPRAFCRFVPERSDDFAWENDLVAFRTYGPALRDSVENSGIDCWFKRVSYPVIDKWYMEDRTKLPYSKKAKPYHEDNGEGYDVYKVGDTRGCGGISVWDGEKIHNSNTFVAHRVIENSPERAVFELDYASDLGGKVLCETRRITLPMGQHMFQSDSRFTLDGEPAAGLNVVIGLKPQVEGSKPVFSPETGTMYIWEKVDGLGLGTGVVIDPKSVQFMKTFKDEAGETQALCFARTDDTGTIRWYSGFGWEGRGTSGPGTESYINSAARWAGAVKQIAERAAKEPFADPSKDPEFKVHAHPVP